MIKISLEDDKNTIEDNKRLESFIERARSHSTPQITKYDNKYNVDLTYQPKITELPNLKQQQENFQQQLTHTISSHKKTHEYYEKLVNPPSVEAKKVKNFKNTQNNENGGGEDESEYQEIIKSKINSINQSFKEKEIEKKLKYKDNLKSIYSDEAKYKEYLNEMKEKLKSRKLLMENQ